MIALEHFYVHFRVSRFHFTTFALSSYAGPRFYVRVLPLLHDQEILHRLPAHYDQPPTVRAQELSFFLYITTSALNSRNHYA